MNAIELAAALAVGIWAGGTGSVAALAVWQEVLLRRARRQGEDILARQRAEYIAQLERMQGVMGSAFAAAGAATADDKPGRTLNS